jgi:hypothetical protein
MTPKEIEVSGGNAVWVKKGYGGNYVWTIVVSADSNSPDDLDIAAERAVAVAQSLEEALPTEKAGQSRK